MKATDRIETARQALLGAGATVAIDHAGGVMSATIATDDDTITDTYLTSDDEVATFLEDEARRLGVKEQRGVAPTRDSKKTTTNPSDTMKRKSSNLSDEVQDLVRSTPNRLAIAGGATMSLFLSTFLTNQILAGRAAWVRQVARVLSPFVAAAIVQRAEHDLAEGVATGMQVDATVALINILSSYVPAIGFVGEKLSANLGDASSTLGGPARIAPADVPAIPMRAERDFDFEMEPDREPQPRQFTPQIMQLESA